MSYLKKKTTIPKQVMSTYIDRIKKEEGNDEKKTA